MRILDLSIAWRIDITDYYYWAGVAGTTVKLKVNSQPEYPIFAPPYAYAIGPHNIEEFDSLALMGTSSAFLGRGPKGEYTLNLRPNQM